MDSSQVSSFLELREVLVHGTSKESSEEGYKSLGETRQEITVGWGEEVS